MVGMKYDPHGRAGQLRTMLENMRNGKAGLSKENVRVICDFHRDMVAESMRIARLCKYVETLKRIAKKLEKPLTELDKDDIKDIVVDIEGNEKLAPWSKHDYKVTLRRFFKWLRGGNREYPPEVSWIKVHVKGKHKLPDELLTEDEVKRMIGACEDARDRAFIQCLYESGGRIGEILTIQLKNLKFDEYGVVVVVTGKTGDRRIRLIASVPALAGWLEFHPYRDMPDAYLFVRRRYGRETQPVPFSYPYAARIIKTLAKQVGITKRVHPHLFRHSRATMMASRLTEAQMKEYFGWVQASDMASVYVHLSGRDVDDAILKINGLKKDEGSNAETFRQAPCARCGNPCPPAAKICSKCGYGFMPEEEKALVKMPDKPLEKTSEKAPVKPPEKPEKSKEPIAPQSILSQLMKDDEFKEVMMKKILEMGLMT